jgi:hypothetical protein
VPLWLTSLVNRFVTREVWIFPTWCNAIRVASRESCYQGYYGLICGICPVRMQESLDSRAMHHARLISDNTDPLKMKGNLKCSMFSSYRAVNALLLVYKEWLTAEWHLLPHDAVNCQSSVRHSVYTRHLNQYTKKELWGPLLRTS